ncbi:SAM-dependent methyltransferase [Halpernia sp. GG3]
MLFLIPAYLSPETPKDYFGKIISEYILKTDYFFVENEKPARKIIKYFCPEKKQSDLKLFIVDKYSKSSDFMEAQKLLREGVDFGLLSDAGLPCIGDPGNIVVKFCHENKIQVIPVNGPSSFVLALIASGFNGQEFTFNGYLPIEKSERKGKISFIEKLVLNTGCTQIFMETPYRNLSLFEDLCKILSPQTKLCIAANINHPTDEYIKTIQVKNWPKEKPNLHKIPTVFLIGK